MVWDEEGCSWGGFRWCEVGIGWCEVWIIIHKDKRVLEPKPMLEV